ncbi:hypothetical protein ABL78_8091 [Leptomonas seymouri]|uniref:Uncharacterized protein n=1 Tax=Leptomonas seymouri TaxID=5684 RepID=A0A0N1P9W5_LEPSE|nr:hypothetical protein ABL78_8091 [Leptomonas seymouri]|eukprot:KPI82893.1 hypothetical protein ABL78_8091 [Leptomonas seymouri]
MSHPSGDKRHLVPLLEFLRFVAQAGRDYRNRFPKKINGPADFVVGRPDFGSESDSSSASSDDRAGFTKSDGRGHLSSVSQGGGVAFANASEGRKRLHSPELDSRTITETTQVPVACEVVVETSDKGRFMSKHVDLPLSDIGLVALVDIKHPILTTEVSKEIKGLPCCYLLLGTLMIVTGRIVDVNLTEETVMVSPDRGQRVRIEWIPLKRVFRVPKNIAEVREEAASRIEQIVEAERRGDQAPKFSPIQLAKYPDTTPSPTSPEVDRQ